MLHTLSQHPGWIYPVAFSSENLVRKITPRWKEFGFFTSPQYHSTYLTNEEIESSIVSSKFLNFPLMSFWISLFVEWQILVKIMVICGKLFPGILGQISWIWKIGFYLILWRAGNWMLLTQKFVHQNTFDEEFLCDNQD